MNPWDESCARRRTPRAFLRACMKVSRLVRVAFVPLAFVPISACNGSDNTGVPPELDAGYVIPTESGLGNDGPAPVSDGGFRLAANPTPPALNSLQPTTLLLTASGEILAFDGYNFPAVNSGDGVFADGWEVRFEHLIATFDKVILWENPDMVPTDQSQVGNLVAEVDGPWAVDLHQNGAGYPYVDGKEAGERAVAFAVVTNENRNGNAPFPTDGTRLAVGFSAVTATANALNVNLGPDGLAQYEAMIQEGCVALYTGQATWKGNVPPGLCVSPGTGGDAGDLGLGGESEFANLPGVVNFTLCFKPRVALAPGTPETSWINCDNQDNDPAAGLNAEPHQRGIAFKSNTYSIGEVTFHTDHPFWESTKHDTPAHFDPFAAQLSGTPADAGIPTVHLTDVIGVDYTGFKDKQGNALPWRICDPNYTNPNGEGRAGPMHFDPVAVPHCTNNDSSNGLCDYYDFSKYNQSTQGHWNGADGLCFVKRLYPSPP
jgi:hypothetical protein